VHFLLEETEKDAPTEEVRKWNILGAAQGILMAWESIMPAVIENRFVKCSFSTAH
jgi:hypothetical protein